ncbi:serine/threonine-protein kinase [Paenibacillus sepulcri]
MDMEGNYGYEIGAVIGERYRIAGLIGQGGMGDVYAAEDLRLQGKLRALKVNKPPTADGLYSAEEAALLMRLNHPRLPLIVDYYPPDEGREILVMDYIDGETLQSRLRSSRTGIMSEVDALETGIQLSDALHYLHMQNPPIIHRDLKPTNVMLDHSGYVRLIDFGIARRYKSGQEHDTVKLGTPGFAAPEQEGERQSDARTDVFGLGALLFYLLSGGTKLQSSGMTGSGMLAHISASVRGVIGQMVDPRPNCRYPSMLEARSALEDCLKNGRAGAQAISIHGPSARAGQRYSLKADKAVVHITVASLSPGAGSTFTSITLARLMQQHGIDCAAVEHPLLEPEWHALLNLEAASSIPDSDRPLDSRFTRTRTSSENHIVWHTLLPELPRESADDALKYRLMMESLNQSVVITDVSSKWTEREAEEQLLSADILLFVVDPLPFKWTPSRIKAAQVLCFERDKQGFATKWIANKDMKFNYRTEWLSMIPGKPAISIPLLPAEAWAELMWSGGWATARKAWMKALEKAFQPFISNLFA